MFRYAQVETALMGLNELHEDNRIALRGRLKNLQRLGVSPEAPGKGSRIEYAFADVMLLALCLEFAQFGIDPTRIAQVKSFIWPHVSGRVCGETIEPDLILVAQPNVLTGVIETGKDIGRSDLGSFRIFSITGNMHRWLYSTADLPSLIEERAIIVHMTNLHTELRRALLRSEKGA